MSVSSGTFDTAVKEVDTIDFREFQEDYVATGTPLLIKSGISDWAAHGRWSTDYFREQVGSVALPVAIIPVGAHKSTGKLSYLRSDLRATMTVNRYLDLAGDCPSVDDQSIQRHYLADVPLDDPDSPLASLLPDIGFPGIVKRESFTGARLFMGYDSYGDMHHHTVAESFLASVVGSKRLVMYHPDDFYRVYPRSIFSRGNHMSRIDDFDDPDYDQFPDFRDARPVEVIVRPGELLYIPLDWWHMVYGIEFSASITFFWKASTKHYKGPRLLVRSLSGETMRRLQDLAVRSMHRMGRLAG